MPNTLQKRWLGKSGRSLGLRQSLGWHTFRHTYRTWLDATGTTMIAITSQNERGGVNTQQLAETLD
jgi:hypothetical protein